MWKLLNSVISDSIGVCYYQAKIKVDIDVDYVVSMQLSIPINELLRANICELIRNSLNEKT